MKKDEITIGGTYLAKVSDKVVPVRIDAANPRGGWDATNMATDKKIRIQSAQRLRGPAPERHGRHAAASTTPQLDEQRTAHQDAQAAAAGESDRVPLTQAMKPAKAAGEKKEKKVSGLDAAHQVLADAGEPMRCGDMVEKMLSTGMWKTGGKTPAATIYAAIVREISTKGTASRFKKTDRGLFTTSAN
jgi:hypothetical protein